MIVRWLIPSICLALFSSVGFSKSDFGVLVPLGTSQTQLETFAFFKKCKRQDDVPAGYVRFTCTNPNKSIREADFLFFNGILVGVNASFKMPGEYDLNDADDVRLLDELRDKIKSTISTAPEVKTWSDARSSRLHEDTTLDFPMELYSNNERGAVLKYICTRSPEGRVRTTVVEATFVFRKEARVYMEMVEAKELSASNDEGRRSVLPKRCSARRMGFCVDGE